MRSSSAVSYLVYVPPVVTVSGSPRSLVSVPYTPTPLSELSGSVSSPNNITTPSCSSDLRNTSSDASHVLTQSVGSELCSCVSLPRTSCVTSVTFSGGECPVVRRRQYILHKPCQIFSLYLPLCPFYSFRIPPQHCLQDWSIL